MAQSSVQRFYELIQTDPVEFDIAILRGADEDGDPFVVQDGHLGLHAGDLAWLARDFRQSYRKARQDYAAELLQKSTTYSSNINVSSKILEITSCLLLLCPDNATAWADRKRALLALTNDPSTGNSGIWAKELQFVSLLMTKHTKAPTSWFHRKYVLQKLMDQSNSNIERLIALAREEIRICSNIAEKYPKNYYAWTHRNYVLENVNDAFKGGGSTEKCNSLRLLLEEEWQSIGLWLRTHVSDHSAAHYGGCVLRRLVQVLSLDDQEAILPILTKATETARQLVCNFPTHEVLWIFRRICSHAMLTHVEQETDSSQGSQLQIQKQLAVFWEEEILLLISDRPRLTDSKLQPALNELHLEAKVTETYESTYVAWVLEWIQRSKLDFVHLGIDRAQFNSIRRKVLESIRGIEGTGTPLIIRNIG
jgi:Protein prenyltransferase alpha subunit repeat